MDILVSEVGPRDGLQSIKRAMPTEAKHRWIRALAEAGLREIEVGSFVPPKLLPQMADAAEVVREAARIPGITVLALAPNLKGAQNAVAAGARVVHAFGTVPSEVLFTVYESRGEPRGPSLAYCGDDADAKQVAARLIRDVGFEPVDAGPLRIARYAEPFALLVAQLAYEGDEGPELAYRFERFGG